MKVLHLVAGELKYGAARGAYWLHRGLIELGVDSYILTDAFEINAGKHVNVCTVSVNKLRKFQKLMRGFIDTIPLYFYKNRKKLIFSSGLIGYDFTKTKLYAEADILHLHWINGGFVSIKTISKVNKPIVWTLRDMWPMTGGCNYSMDCDRFKIGCGSCPQLGSKFNFDATRFIMFLKRKYFPLDKINLVGISNWITQKAKESLLFSDSKGIITTIHNCVDTKNFFPINKNVAKEVLSIPRTKKAILYGAVKINDFYKGFDKFLEAISFLNKKDYIIVLFGKADKETYDMLRKIKIEYIDLGFLQDDISLRLAYSAADVFVSTSIYEAFGKTLIEAMACGTPVVCFDATGPKDIVDHKENGYKAIPYEPKDVAYGIDFICNNTKYEEIAKNARSKVVNEFDCLVIAKKYIDLYETIINRKK